jgi:CRISPR-associated endonuclease Csn1
MNKAQIQENSNIILGLDIGKASVGFALVDKANDYKIINAGVRIFDAPEKAKTKTSLNSARAEFRRSRNAKKNEFKRTKEVIKCLIKYNILDERKINAFKDSTKIINLPKSKKRHLFYIKTAEYLFHKQSNAEDILSLRVKALNEKITPLELARILYSLNKHRGITYDSIQDVKIGSNLSDEQKELKKGIDKYNKEFNHTQTVGLFLYENYKRKFRNTDFNKHNKKKNKPNYIFSIPRMDLKDEIEIIFEKQKEFDNPLITKDFQEDYIQWFLWEEESPRYDSLVSYCSYDIDNKVANKHHFYSLLYIALEKLHNMGLNKTQIKTILSNSFEQVGGITYKKIKTILNLKDLSFKGVLDESKIAITFESFIRIKKIFNIKFDFETAINDEHHFIHTKLKNIINILAYAPTQTLKEKELKELNINDNDIKELIDKVKIRGHLRYSLNIIKKLCNYMLDGDIPYNAKDKIENEYGVEIITKTPYLPPIMDTSFPLKNNHNVVRALSQVRTVINDILKFYRKQSNNTQWSFDTVVIELARDMNNKKQISQIEKDIKAHTKANQEAKDFCEDYNIHNPTHYQILKAKLFKLQNGIDPYTMRISKNNPNINELSKINPNHLFDESYYEIDHILPHSRSLDDSQSNKVLVSQKENQNKGDKTPYEWMDKESFKHFENYIKEKKTYLSYGSARVRKLLNKDFKGIDGFKQRDIVDTQIISKYAGLYIDKYLYFWDNPNFKSKRRVFANNGKITSILRKAWAIGKKNRGNHLHHGEDAIIIACSTPAIIQKIAIFISKQTELSTGLLTLDKFNRVLKKEIKLKNTILSYLKKENINIEKINFNSKEEKKAFTSRIFKIIAISNYPYDGFREDFKTIIENAPVTHFVKYKTNGSIHDEHIEKIPKDSDKKGFIVRNGIARNGEFVRYDVFKMTNQKGKITYKFIALTAMYKNKPLSELPNPKIKQNEKSSFIFSVFKNDLLRYSLKDKSIIKGRFRKIDSSMVVDESKNQENDLFRKQIKRIDFSFTKTDDVVNMKDILNDETINISIDLSRTKKIETIIKKIKDFCNDKKENLKKNYKLNSKFIMLEMTAIQMIEVRSKLIDDKTVLDKIEDNEDIKKTIFVYMSESDYIPSKREDGTTTLINLEKLQTNCLGEETIITQEKRKTF